MVKGWRRKEITTRIVGALGLLTILMIFVGIYKLCQQYGFQVLWYLFGALVIFSLYAYFSPTPRGEDLFENEEYRRLKTREKLVLWIDQRITVVEVIAVLFIVLIIAFYYFLIF